MIFNYINTFYFEKRWIPGQTSAHSGGSQLRDLFFSWVVVQPLLCMGTMGHDFSGGLKMARYVNRSILLYFLIYNIR